MRKILITMLLPLSTFAQINFEHEFLGTSVGVVNFSSNGTKLQETDTGIVAWFKLYDQSFNLWKTVNIPQLPGWDAVMVGNITDNLFNSDNSIEFGVTYREIGVANSYNFRVYDEQFNILLEVPGGYWGYVLNTDPSNEVYKLAVWQWIPSGNTFHFKNRVYSLPGSLPCMSCGPLKVPKATKQQPFLSEPIPNPSTGQVTISYFMTSDDRSGEITIYNVNGQQVATYPIKNSEYQITLLTGSLIPGSYYYQLKTANSLSESKKLIILK